jgi:hypothetical protein
MMLPANSSISASVPPSRIRSITGCSPSPNPNCGRSSSTPGRSWNHAPSWSSSAASRDSDRLLRAPM